MSKIPKVIYYTTDKPLAPDLKIYEIIEKNKIQGFECKVFDTNESREFLKKHFPEKVLLCYDLLVPIAYKSDFFRYCVLYINGGIYLDLGLLLVDNLESLLNYELVVVKDRVYNKATHMVWNGFIMTKPKNELFMKCIDNICKKVFYFYKGVDPLDLSGPSCFGKIINSYYNIKINHTFKSAKIKVLRWNEKVKNIFDDNKKYCHLMKYEHGFSKIYREELKKSSWNMLLKRYDALWHANKVFTLIRIGSWSKSSRNYRIVNNYLMAHCRNGAGKYINNKVKIEIGKYNYINNNGKLRSSG